MVVTGAEGETNNADSVLFQMSVLGVFFTAESCIGEKLSAQSIIALFNSGNILFIKHHMLNAIY
jgi:hypothetical protein